MNERGLGPATARQLWRLNREGLLALRKEAGAPLVNRQCAAEIARLSTTGSARETARNEKGGGK
jgi:hypothetical protein